eukprot:7371491-Lingulodinium_polyedra.AAC.1
MVVLANVLMRNPVLKMEMIVSITVLDTGTMKPMANMVVTATMTLKEKVSTDCEHRQCRRHVDMDL